MVDLHYYITLAIWYGDATYWALLITHGEFLSSDNIHLRVKTSMLEALMSTTEPILKKLPFKNKRKKFMRYWNIKGNT